MAKVMAVATLHTMNPGVNGITGLAFAADYNDPRNKEWSKYTPSFTVHMAVTDEIAKGFKTGEVYEVTFEPRRSAPIV